MIKKFDEYINESLLFDSIDNFIIKIYTITKVFGDTDDVKKIYFENFDTSDKEWKTLVDGGTDLGEVFTILETQEHTQFAYLRMVVPECIYKKYHFFKGNSITFEEINKNYKEYSKELNSDYLSALSK